jgi:WD40 repeat protein
LDQSKPSEIKVCKFLNPHNLLVSADLDGYLNFYAVYPSHNRNTLLYTVKDDIESEVGTLENFPIRSLDYDIEENVIYSGDEMGYMHKWDVSNLVAAQRQEDIQYDKE